MEPVATSLELPRAQASRSSKGVHTNSYIPGLDGIRALAFMTVFCAHSLPAVSYFIPATLGVTIFFFLSGYLITTLLRREIERTGTISLRDFYIRRTIRIFVPLCVVYALILLVSRFITHTALGNTFGLTSVLFYFHNYTLALRANAWVPDGLEVVWSLSVEEHFYILFPIIYLTMMVRRVSARTQVRVLIGFCLVELLWRVFLWTVLKQTGAWTYVTTDCRLDSILWGSILAMRNNPLFGDRSILPRRQTLAFGITVAFLFSTLALRNLLYRNTLRYTLQALALYVIFSFVVSNIGHWSVRWLEWTPVRYIGWISYVLYLSHAFFVACVERAIPNTLWLRSLTAFVVSVTFATVMRYTMELPLQRLRARFRHVPEADPTARDGHGLIA